VDAGFDFASFVTDFLTEEFAKMVKLELLMWIIAVVFVAVPANSYAGIWMTGTFVLLSVVAGAKLRVIAMHLARHAYSMFYAPDSLTASQHGSHVGSDDNGRGSLHTSEVGVEANRWHEAQLPAVVPAETLPHLLHGSRLPDKKEGAPEKDHQMRSSPLHPTRCLLAQPIAESKEELASGHRSSEEITMGQRGTRRVLFNNRLEGNAAPDASTSEQAVVQEEGREGHIAYTCCHGCRTPLLMQRLGRQQTKAIARFMRGHSAHVLSNKVDFEKLFWFKTPRLMLRVFQYAYFENALSLAIVVFALWQHENKMFAGVASGGRLNAARLATSLALLALDLVLLFHSAAFVLPLYALTAASVHYQSPDTLLDFAKKRGVRPDLVQFLEETNPSTLVRSRDGCCVPCIWKLENRLYTSPSLKLHLVLLSACDP
jgi:hypothetical protein